MRHRPRDGVGSGSAALAKGSAPPPPRRMVSADALAGGQPSVFILIAAVVTSSIYRDLVSDRHLEGPFLL